MDRVISLGVLCDGIEVLPQLVEALLDHPCVATSDLGVMAPFYQGTPTLVEVHRATRPGRARLLAYLRHGVLDESTRCVIAGRFAADFRRRYGRAERRDLLVASADMLRVEVALKALAALDPAQRDRVLRSIAARPHDVDTFAREQEPIAPRDDGDGTGSELAAGGGEIYLLAMKIFIDHVYNPRRQQHPAVQEALAAHPMQRPAIIELWAPPAIPGYADLVVKDIAPAVDGVALWFD